MTSDLGNQADWLAAEGFLAAAPDLLDGGSLLRCLRQMVRDYTRWEGQLFDDIEAVRQWLAGRADCTGRVGVVGFCMGGGFALSLAPRGGFGAAAANYGGLPKDPAEFFRGACPIVASYGRRDRSLRGAADRLRAALTEAEVPHDVREYAEAGHGFLNDHGRGEVPVIFQILGWTVHDRFHFDSAADAQRRTADFLHRHLDA
jgi:carboxymethylenebutenolidase